MTSRTRVKVCGVTRLEDALAAAACGVDAIGFNFWSTSSRYIEKTVAASIANQLPDSVTKVGLFVNAETTLIDQVLSEVDLDFLQFHGVESRETCVAFGMPYIKAIRATSAEEIKIEVGKYKDAKAILLDTPARGQFGGSGSAFDWRIIPTLDMPLILAGGLAPQNVVDAILQVQPCVVDVASGVESGKGIKDKVVMRQFMVAVQQADRSK